MTWPSRLGNNDDTASYHQVHVYKRCRCEALQSVSASLNDPLMSAVGVHASIGSQRRHVMGTGQLLNLSFGSGAIDAGSLDSEPQRWHVGLGWWGTGQCNCSSRALCSLQGKLYPIS